MAGHRLGGTNDHLVGMLAKGALDRRCLDFITDRRRSAMRVDVADLFRVDAGITHSIAHDTEATISIFGGLGDVVGVCTHAGADDFGKNLRVSLLSMLEFFQNHDASAFPDHKAVAILVPWTAGAMWIIVACGKSAHSRKSTDAHRSDRSLGAAGNHHVGIAVLDDACSVADGVGAGGASRTSRLVRTLGVVTHTDLSSGEVYDGRRNEER